MHWSGTAEDDATWEPFLDLQQWFPHLNIEDKILLPRAQNVMSKVHMEPNGNHVQSSGEIAENG